MTSLAVRRPAANTTSIWEGYVSCPRRNIYSVRTNLKVKVLEFAQRGGLCHQDAIVLICACHRVYQGIH